MAVTTIQEAIKDPRWGSLSPAAKEEVFSRLTANDEKFGSLSPAAQSVVKRRVIGSQKTAPELPKAEPIGPYIKERAKRGFGESLGHTVEFAGMVTDQMPVMSLVNKLHEKLGFSKEEFAEQLKDLGRRAVGAKEQIEIPKGASGKPRDDARYLGAVAEMAGSSFVPGVGVIGAAQRKILAALMELSMSVTGGLGAEAGADVGKAVANQFGLDEEKAEGVGRMVGAIGATGGTVASGVALTRGGGAAVRKTRETTGFDQPISRKAQESAGQRMAGQEIVGAMEADPQAVARMKEAAEVSRQIPGFSPTIAQRSGAPGVRAIEERVQSSSPQDLARARSVEESNIEAIRRAEQKAIPQERTSIVAPVRQAVKEQGRILEDRLSVLERRERALSQRFMGADSPESVGKTLREVRQQKKTVAKSAADAKYEDFYRSAERAGLREDVSDINVLVKQMIEEGEDVADVIPSLFSRLRKATAAKREVAEEIPALVDPSGRPLREAEEAIPSVDVEVRELHAMFKAANRDLRAAQLAGRAYDARRIAGIKEELGRKLEAFGGDELGDVAVKFRDAQDFYRNKYAKVFKEGLGGKMGAFNKYGMRVADEDVVEQLLLSKRGQAASADDFLRIYGDDPTAMKALKDGLTDYFAGKVMVNGVIDPKKADSFLETHRDFFKRFPGLRREFSDAEFMSRKITDFKAEVHQHMKELDKNVLSSISGAQNEAEVISRALKEPEYMIGLVRSAKTKTEKQSLVRALSYEIQGMKDPYGFLSSRPDMKPIMNMLGKGHYENLETLAKARTIMGRAKAPSHAQTIGFVDPVAAKTGMSPQAWFSQIQAKVRGYQSGPYTAFNIGGKFFYKIRTEQFEKAIREAIYDPDLAESLAKMTTGPATKPKLNRMANHLASHGVRVISINEEDREPEE